MSLDGKAARADAAAHKSRKGSLATAASLVILSSTPAIHLLHLARKTIVHAESLEDSLIRDGEVGETVIVGPNELDDS